MSQNDGELIRLQRFLEVAFEDVTEIRVCGAWRRFAGVGRRGTDKFVVASVHRSSDVILLHDLTAIENVRIKRSQRHRYRMEVPS